MPFDVRRYMTFGVGTVAMAVLVSGQSPHSDRRPTAAPAPSPSPSATAALQPSSAEFDDFLAVAGKPAASAPIRKLPHIRLSSVSVAGIPPVPLTAYRRAAHARAAFQPGCHLPWWLLAGIGFVESGHAHSGGSGHAGWRGVARPPIYGPRLDGSHGFKAIRDTDNGRLDGDRRWDRAVGPMQFLPSTWRTWGAADGRLGNPQAIVPAAAATARYLCAGSLDLGTPAGLARAVFSYNHSFDYVRLVLSVAARYAGLDAADLGVDDLPTDAEFRHHLRDRDGTGDRRTRDSSTRDGGTGGTSPSPSPEPAASTSPSPSPSPTSGGTGPLPQPSPSATLLPLPTTSGLLNQLP